MAVIKEENYHDEQNKNNILKLRKVLDTLPPFCRDFFRGIEPYTSTRTRLAYAYDIRLFFEFLHETNSFCKKREITELPLSVLDMVQRTDIEDYLDDPDNGKDYMRLTLDVVRCMDSLLRQENLM